MYSPCAGAFQSGLPTADCGVQASMAVAPAVLACHIRMVPGLSPHPPASQARVLAVLTTEPATLLVAPVSLGNARGEAVPLVVVVVVVVVDGSVQPA
jgi:hypothetical protein